MTRISKAENTLSVLVPLLILFSYIGRGLYNSSLFLVLLLTIYIVYTKKERIVFGDNLFKSFTFFALAVLFTSIFSIDILHSLSKYKTFAITSITVIVVGLHLYKYSANAEKNIIKALYILFASSVAMEFTTIIGMLINTDILLYIKSLGSSVQPLAGSYHLRSLFTAAIIPLGIFLYYVKPSKIKIILLVIAMIGILASTSRTAIVASILPVMLFILIKNKYKIFNKDLVVFFSIIAISLSLAFIISPKIQDRVKTFSTTFSTSGDQMGGRYPLYKRSIELFKNSPLFGHGVKSGVALYKANKYNNKHAHNIWLELLVDTGIVGFFSFLVFLAFILKGYAKKLKHSCYIHRAVIWSSMLSIFLSSLTMWSIWSGNHIGPILVIIMILYGLPIKLHKS